MDPFRLGLYDILVETKQIDLKNNPYHLPKDDMDFIPQQ